MRNHFEPGYTFATETGEQRYIAFVDYDCGIPHYDTYPVSVKEQLEKNPDLLFDWDFTDKHRICMEEHELYELKIKALEKQLAEKQQKISVETQLGTLEACLGGDPQYYPEIFAYIRRPDGIEIDLVAVEVKEEGFVRGYLYTDTHTEEYTKTIDWTADDINVELDDDVRLWTAEQNTEGEEE